MPAKKIPVEIRFSQKYIPVTNCGCWLWTDAPGKDGYGVLQIEGKAVKAHRVSFMLHKGEIPKGKLVCHTCDVRSCVNPDHLYAGSYQDNSDDAVRRKRTVVMRNPSPGSKNGRAILKDEDINDILYAYFYLNISSGILSEKYGLTSSAIVRIISGLSWKHVDRSWIDESIKAQARKKVANNRKKPIPHIRLTKKGAVHINSKKHD